MQERLSEILQIMLIREVKKIIKKRLHKIWNISKKKKNEDFLKFLSYYNYPLN